MIATAIADIAVLLLQRGTTVHLRFGIPLQLHTDPINGFSMQSDWVVVLRQAAIMVADEATMADKEIFALPDTLFCALIKSVDHALDDVLFEEKLIVVSGDGRRLSPGSATRRPRSHLHVWRDTTVGQHL